MALRLRPSAAAAASALPSHRSSAFWISRRSMVSRLSSSGAGPAGAGRQARSAAAIRRPPPSRTARSTTWSSSRTFPGQGYWSSAWSASSVKPSKSFRYRRPCRPRKWAASTGMSSRRSRRGGRRISTVLRRKNRSWRNRPAATSAGRSALVADSTRTSATWVRDEPTRSNSPHSSTRSSLAWSAGGMLAISSRKRVPP